ncbi:MAG: hypothetical protein JJLCMIEE_01521 [Acidimicrobiales bacterium]|nr:MAG: hypothetical protein EDR02_06135 [Actinomycetota bacterium]MBV6508458.1 hypothetical protein [Acidimicrobiales bacterium]RIK04738.1 MAG: hypothetical protein DCC48_11830 [Acidobacteriota bacterium]
MAMKGKWAQGIKPRNFHWIIKDQLAICERPGGYGANHRRVRRQEEIIWIREQGFNFVISLIGAPHNLHNYDELSVAWRHRPLPTNDEQGRYLNALYNEFGDLLDAEQKLLVHQEELGDRVSGLMAGYLVWSRMVPSEPRAISLIEQIVERQIGPVGRELVAQAGELVRRRED